MNKPTPRADDLALIERWERVASDSDTRRLCALARAGLDAPALQAAIDRLMLEYCPEDMTPEQRAEWGRNQRAAPAEAADAPFVPAEFDEYVRQREKRMAAPAMPPDVAALCAEAEQCEAMLDGDYEREAAAQDMIRALAAALRTIAGERDEAREGWRVSVQAVGAECDRATQAEAAIAAANAERDGAIKRSQMMLDAKNEWADRARKAQARTEELFSALEHLVVEAGDFDRVARSPLNHALNAARAAIADSSGVIRGGPRDPAAVWFDKAREAEAALAAANAEKRDLWEYVDAMEAINLILDDGETPMPAALARINAAQTKLKQYAAIAAGGK